MTNPYQLHLRRRIDQLEEQQAARIKQHRRNVQLAESLIETKQREIENLKAQLGRV